MEENKYYTPNLEEFRIGFEYELLTPNDVWIKEIYGGDRPFLGWMLPFDSNDKYCEQYVRVKYLDAEDIQSLGWKYNGIFYEKGCHELSGQLKFQDVEINEVIEEMLYGELQRNYNIKFNGKIKNKSELKMIMKMINIK